MKTFAHLFLSTSGTAEPREIKLDSVSVEKENRRIPTHDLLEPPR